MFFRSSAYATVRCFLHRSGKRFVLDGFRQFFESPKTDTLLPRMQDLAGVPLVVQPES